jgi:predicted TPR repeat methyltransferase
MISYLLTANCFIGVYMPQISTAENIRQAQWFQYIKKYTGSFGTWLDEALLKTQDLAGTNYKLGQTMFERGLYKDAIFRYKVALWRDPNHIPSIQGMARAQLALGRDTEAAQNLVKVIKAQNNNDEAKFILSSLQPTSLSLEHRPKTMPKNLLLEDFAKQAKTYNAAQEARQYKGAALTYQLLHNEFPKDIVLHDMLDLACGTGLVGAQFRERFSNIVGVDISEAMLNEAYRLLDKRDVRIYTKLENADVNNYLHTLGAGTFDLITCINSAQYIGDVQNIFAKVGTILREGGFFCITFQPYNAAGYGLSANTRLFAHAANYMESLATNAGLKTVRTGEIMIYPSTPMQLHIYKKLQQ